MAARLSGNDSYPSYFILCDINIKLLLSSIYHLGPVTNSYRLVIRSRETVLWTRDLNPILKRIHKLYYSGQSKVIDNSNPI